MQQLGQYVVNLTAASLLCGILLSMFPEGTVRSLLRLCCGVFLTVTALAPLPGIRLPENFADAQSYFLEGKAMAAQGEKLAAEDRQQRIKLGLESYIQDKAAGLPARVQPEISLEDGGMSVRLPGAWTEEARQRLTEIITNDLGIPEEDQQWIQQTQWNESGNFGENTGGQP